MSNKTTLTDYLVACNAVLESGDNNKAGNLVETIVNVLRKDFPNISDGLYAYAPLPPIIDVDNYQPEETDYLHDVMILKEKIKMELNNIANLSYCNNLNDGDKSHKLFISHNSKDVDYVKALINLLENIGLNEKHIFCTSIPGYDVRLNEDIYAELHNQFLKNKLHVIFLLSPNYYDSAASLNEMGAAWMIRTKYTCFLTPGFAYEDMKGVINKNRIAIKFDDEETVRNRLAQFRDNLIQEFGLSGMHEARWERNREEFLERVGKIANMQKKTQDFVPVEEVIPKNQNSLQNLSIEAQILLVFTSISNSAQIMFINVLGGSVLSFGDKSINLGANARLRAKWESAIDQILFNGFIKLIGNKDGIYSLTELGFKAADEIIKAGSIDVEKTLNDYPIQFA